MIKKIMIYILIVFILITSFQSVAYASTDRVLLVYDNKEEMWIISNLIRACGMNPEPVYIVEYSNDMIQEYEYVVLQAKEPLEDVLKLGKRPVCLGDDFNEIPGAKTVSVNRKMHAQLDVYDNTQSVFFEKGCTYIFDFEGEPVGSMSVEGNSVPIGIITENIMYAPYFNNDDISIFAVAQMLNEYFGKKDGGEMYIVIDEVYPFDEINILKLTADKFYETGIPFIMSLMPVYDNTDYPSYKRYAQALRYIQSKNGSFIMRAPIVTENELVGDDIDVRMERAYKSFEENGVHIYDNEFPYEVSSEMLGRIHPKNERYTSLPIDTSIRFELFQNESEIDTAIKLVNDKWLLIGDYKYKFTDQAYVMDEEEEDSVYVYREETERTFSFLVDTGNKMLTTIVLISGVIIIALIAFGYTLYRQKFFKK